MRRWIVRLAAACLALCCLSRPAHAQQLTAIERAQAETMLQDVSNDVKKHYFDPLALGSGWDAKVRETRKKIDNSTSLNQALSHIAALLDSLNDSHTFFVPPSRPYRQDYGFRMQMIGDRCYVTHVRPGSDAEKKGLLAGDELVALDDYRPTREDLWRMQYLFGVLEPQPELRLKLRSRDGNPQQVDVTASFRELPAITERDVSGSAMFDGLRNMENRHDSLLPLYAARGDKLPGSGVLIVKLPELTLSAAEADAVLARMRSYNAVILDLRGDPGGSEETLKRLLGGVFEKPVKIGDPVGRRLSPPIMTEPQAHPYLGKLMVLIDSQSGSAAELFARVIQLEKRGVTMGDTSAGKVMAAEQYMHQAGMNSVIVYGATVTEAEIHMSDGQSLEHIGVTPDKTILPTASDLADGRDPVLAAAAEMLNFRMSPEEAGALFPFHWPEQ